MEYKRNKIGKVIRELESRNQDIIVLSETEMKGNGIETNGAYMHFHTGIQKDQRTKLGPSVLIKNKFR